MIRRYGLKSLAGALAVLIAAHLPAQGAASEAERHIREGARFLQAKDYRAAAEAFKKAAGERDRDASLHLGLGVAYFNLREDRDAERAFSKAIEIDPQLAMAHHMLGELAYRRDDLDAAMRSWERALELDPGNARTRARLERVRKEHRTEKDFNRDVTSHFLVKYEGRERIEAGRIVLRVLEDAYGAIGRELSYYPEREIQVILYSGTQFQEVTDAPGWSGGIFDGKIRIPIGGIEQETPGLRRILFHEYTHAVVRAITQRVPTWLNEGLAQYFEGRQLDRGRMESLHRLNRAGDLPSLSQLEGSFLGLGGKQAMLAYDASLSVVAYIVERHGLYRIRGMLDELGGGASVRAAVDAGLGISYDDLEHEWRRTFE